jgi:hypothetical protein
MLIGGSEDNVLTALCHRVNLAGRIIERVKPADFSTQTYRTIAAAAIAFYEEYQRPPGMHICDLLETAIRASNEGRFMSEILRELERQASAARRGLCPRQSRQAPRHRRDDKGQQRTGRAAA